MTLQKTAIIMCRICLDLVHPSTTCSCGNVGVIVDDDGHTNIYVDSIKTTQRAILYHTGDFKEVHRELLQPFGEALYIDYSLRHTPFYFKPYALKSKIPRVTSTEYDQNLIAALDRHKYKTSDGTERFKRSALQEPQK